MPDAADRAVALQAVLLESLPPDLADTLMRQSATRRFARGETVFLHGEPSSTSASCWKAV